MSSLGRWTSPSKCGSVAENLFSIFSSPTHFFFSSFSAWLFLSFLPFFFQINSHLLWQASLEVVPHLSFPLRVAGHFSFPFFKLLCLLCLPSSLLASTTKYHLKLLTIVKKKIKITSNGHIWIQCELYDCQVNVAIGNR